MEKEIPEKVLNRVQSNGWQMKAKEGYRLLSHQDKLRYNANWLDNAITFKTEEIQDRLKSEQSGLRHIAPVAINALIGGLSAVGGAKIVQVLNREQLGNKGLQYTLMAGSALGGLFGLYQNIEGNSARTAIWEARDLDALVTMRGWLEETHGKEALAGGEAVNHKLWRSIIDKQTTLGDEKEKWTDSVKNSRDVNRFFSGAPYAK